MSEKNANTTPDSYDEPPSKADIKAMPPPSYEPGHNMTQCELPSYPEMQLQEFIFTEGMNFYNHNIFTNQNSLTKYKSWKRLRHGEPEFAHAKESQNLSIGMPLIVSKRSYAMGFGDTTFLKLYETLPSPEASDRLYDKVDNRQIGEVFRRRFSSYYRYKLQFKDTEIVVIHHGRLPIFDFQIGPDRFRFIRQIMGFTLKTFSYVLYLLDPKQPSLVDNLDASLKVNEANPLLGKAIKNILLAWTPTNRETYASSNKVGVFDYIYSLDMSARNSRCSSLSLFTAAGPQQEANTAVEERSLIILGVALILQALEDRKRTE